MPRCRFTCCIPSVVLPGYCGQFHLINLFLRAFSSDFPFRRTPQSLSFSLPWYWFPVCCQTFRQFTCSWERAPICWMLPETSLCDSTSLQKFCYKLCFQVANLSVYSSVRCMFWKSLLPVVSHHAPVPWGTGLFRIRVIRFWSDIPPYRFPAWPFPVPENRITLVLLSCIM